MNQFFIKYPYMYQDNLTNFVTVLVFAVIIYIFMKIMRRPCINKKVESFSESEQSVFITDAVLNFKNLFSEAVFVENTNTKDTKVLASKCSALKNAMKKFQEEQSGVEELNKNKKEIMTDEIKNYMSSIGLTENKFKKIMMNALTNCASLSESNDDKIIVKDIANMIEDAQNVLKTETPSKLICSNLGLAGKKMVSAMSQVEDKGEEEKIKMDFMMVGVLHAHNLTGTGFQELMKSAVEHCKEKGSLSNPGINHCVLNGDNDVEYTTSLSCSENNMCDSLKTEKDCTSWQPSGLLKSEMNMSSVCDWNNDISKCKSNGKSIMTNKC